MKLFLLLIGSLSVARGAVYANATSPEPEPESESEPELPGCNITAANGQECFYSCPEAEPATCEVAKARLAAGGCAATCPDCMPIPKPLNNATCGNAGALRGNAAADPCAAEKDAKDKGYCDTAKLVAPECKCIDKYKFLMQVANNGKDTVDKDECKKMQPLFDCTKKEANWDKCKALGGGEATYDKSTFKTQEDACAELTVSPASSTGAGMLLGLSALGAAALLL